MQVTETLAEGLKRQFEVTIEAKLLADELNKKIADAKGKISIKGFRPGKVPEAHIRQVYGRSLMGELVQEKVQSACDDIVKDKGFKVTQRPSVDFGKDDSQLENIMEGKADLAFTVDLELFPDFDLIDFSTLSLVRPVADVSDEEIDKALETVRARTRSFSAADKKTKSASGDRVKVDFLGTLDGEPFAGGEAKDAQIDLGQGGYVPGFEEALTGVKAGQELKAKITMPEDYHATDLAGKEVEFAFSVHEVMKADEDKPLDEVAKSFGMEGEKALRDAIAAQVKNEHDQASRAKVKRALLDALDGVYSFDVPPSLLEREFAQIWHRVQHEKGAHSHDHDHDHSDEHSSPEEESEKEEYRRIAARRIRLGLVMSRLGSENKIALTDDEKNRAIQGFMRQYPGQEQAVINELRSNPALLEQISAPALEEKVVDFILGLTKITDETVSLEDLMKPIEDD